MLLYLTSICTKSFVGWGFAADSTAAGESRGGKGRLGEEVRGGSSMKRK